MHIKIYQIDKEKDKSLVGFLDLKRTTELSSKVNPSIYKTVFDGEVDCKSWGEIFTLFNSSDIPFTHQGRSLSISDVVEVIEAPMLVGTIKFYVSDDIYQIVNYIDSDKYNYDIYDARKSGRRIEATQLIDKNIPAINPGTYFCDLQDFKKIDFDTTLVAPMEGNRMVNGDILAGNILIACDDGMGRTKDLSNEQVEKYKKQFEADETYTQDEVQSSAYMFFIGF